MEIPDAPISGLAVGFVIAFAFVAVFIGYTETKPKFGVKLVLYGLYLIAAGVLLPLLSQYPQTDILALLLLRDATDPYALGSLIYVGYGAVVGGPLYIALSKLTHKPRKHVDGANL